MARTGVVNCDVLTLDDRECASALLLDGNKIAFVSDSEKGVLTKLRTGDAILDIEGRCVLPGFIDSHTHISTVGMMELGADLSGAGSKNEIARRIRQKLNGIGPNGWLYARGWDESAWGGDYVTKEDLDKASKDKCVVAVRVCGHLATVNARALAAIMGDLKGHKGFYDLKNGILKEDTVGVATKKVHNSEGTMKRAIASGQRRALTLGVTSVHDVVNEHRMRAYYELWQERALVIRTCMNVESADVKGMLDSRLRTGYGNEWLRIGGVKDYTDGSIGARTAALGEPYADDPRNCGTMLLSHEKLNSLARTFASKGFQLCVHAIGDRAVRELVDALSKARPVRGFAHRVEHAEMISDEDLEKVKAHKVALSMQPNFIGQWGQIGDMYEKRLGKKRTSRMNPFKKIVDSGVTLAFGSDCMPLDPLYGIRSAVDAPYVGQRLKPIEALRAYTRAGAALSGESDIKGRISKGMLADLVVLSHNPIKELAKARVDATIVDGKVAWRRRRFKVKKT